MRIHSDRTIGVLALLIPVVIAWTGFGRNLTLQPESRLWIEGSSTVRSFECKAEAFEATVATTDQAAVSAVLSAQKAVSSVELTVPAEQLECGNGTMNDHMRKALKAKDHPTITFRVSSYALATATAGAGVQGTLQGELTLGGVTKPITVEAVANDGGDGTLLVTGQHLIRMKEFGLKPPTLMLGTLRVDEKVNVRFELYLRN